MALHRWLRSVGPTLLGCAVLQLAAPAQACSPPFCTAPVRLPPGGRLPGNLFYFKVLVEDPGVLSLRTAEGEPIAASIRSIGNDRVFAPEQPIAANTSVVLEYTTECALEGVPQSSEFLADPPSSIELGPAELTVLEQGTASPGLPDEASFVRLRYLSGDANGTATALMDHTFTVDGLPAQLGEVNGQQVVQVSARCRPSDTRSQQDTCDTVYSVAPGVHTVEARTTIVGEVTQPDPVRLAVEVRCPSDPAKATADDPAPDELLPDGPGLTQDELDRRTATLDRVGNDDALIDARGAQPEVKPAAASGGGGCSVALRPPRGASSTMAAGLGALLFMSAVARRRSR